MLETVTSHTYGLIVLLPDAIRQNLVPAIGTHLAQHSLYPTAARSVVMGQRDMDVLYGGLPRSKGSDNGRRYGPFLTRALFELDNSIVVLVRGPLGADVASAVHNLKGPSSYLQRREGALRMISPLEDRCMSLVHTPDDWQQTVQHAEHYFPATAVKMAEHATEDIGWDRIARLRSYLDVRAAHSRYEIAVRLVARVVTVALLHYEFISNVQNVHSSLALIDCWLSTPSSEGHAEHRRFVDLMTALEKMNISAGLAENVDAVHYGLLISMLVNTASYSYTILERIFAYLDLLNLRLTDVEAHWLRVLVSFLHE